MGQLHPELERILITTEEIQARVIELSKQITADFSDAEQLYIVGILKGAFIFMADLTRHLQVDHTVDFMALSSYGKTTTTGAVRILMDLREPIDGKHVLIIEDIVDSGNTLSYLLRILRGRKPTTLRTCALLRKQREAIDIPIDYLGFDIPDEWVVGYGLDFAEKHRTLPYIATIKR
ncbi:MAG: hypoxanthine phosphoribosyltransferase [Anaerolineales bacterium]|nr:hypoxanthine phosphoribosyltransferase [Anaerolineales bacterium]